MPLMCLSCSNQNNDGYHLFWSDEFDGTSLNEEYWSYMLGNGAEYGNPGWGNGELEYYQKENVYVQDGQLHIKAKREMVNEFNFTSGRIRTEKKVHFKYGKVEASIALPKGKGMWPAFWMLPEEFAYGGWPDSGEIDIMEANGASTTGTSCALHFSSQRGVDKYITSYHSVDVRAGETTEDFHKYGLVWEEEDITFYVDDMEVLNVPIRSWSSGTVNKEDNPYAPFDRDFHLLLNLAVGGNYTNHTTPDMSFVEAEMVVDYVRIYQFND